MSFILLQLLLYYSKNENMIARAKKYIDAIIDAQDSEEMSRLLK